MPMCSVIGCGIRKTPDQPSLTMHRIPRNEYKKKKWLEAIRMENINQNVKDVFICSLHFDDQCFNKTLDVTRLRDDAVPSKFQHPSQRKTGLLKENQLETIHVLAGPDTSTLVLPIVVNTSTHTAPHAVAGNSGIATSIQHASQHKTGISKENQLETIRVLAGPGTSSLVPPKVANTTTPTARYAGIATFISQAHRIKNLENKYVFLRKKVKILNEKVRRNKEKIANCQNIIKHLHETNLVNNKNSIVLEACAGPKDFLKRLISKSEGAPLEEQYSKEIRKFALALYRISPKAYNFVRRTYNTCLPHPRTLARWYQKTNAEPRLCEEASEALQNEDQSETHSET